MKQLVLFFLVTFCCFSISTDAQDAKAYMSKEFSANVKSVQAETTGGNISVFAAPGHTRVDVFVNANNGWKNKLSDEEIAKKLDEDYAINIAEAGGNITVSAKPKHRMNDWKKSLSISFKIYTNKNTVADLRTSGGNIELDGLAADKKFQTSGGNLVLRKLSGRSKGSTSGGNIILSNSTDQLKLTTSGGNIEAESSTGEIDMSTSGGNIRVSNLKGKVAISTSGGNIKANNISGELATNTSGGNVSLQDLDCSLKAGTSGGNIDISMKGIGNYVTVRNSSGKVNLEIPRNSGVDLMLRGEKISIPSINNFKGSMEKDKVNGSLNGGGVPVRVDAGSGNINIAFN